jgi:hypothetical protein
VFALRTAARSDALLEFHHLELDLLDVLSRGVLNHRLLLRGELDPNLAVGENVGMLQTGDSFDLAQEAVWPQDGCQFRVKHFERDGAIVFEILG